MLGHYHIFKHNFWSHWLGEIVGSLIYLDEVVTGAMILQNVEEKECETENKIDRISKRIVFTDLWSKNVNRVDSIRFKCIRWTDWIPQSSLKWEMLKLYLDR